MRVLASALAAALVLGATPALADVPAAKKTVRTAEASGAAKQQNGKVLVIPAKPSVRSRVSAWLSSWRSNGGEVAGAAAAADDQPQPKAKKQRRAASKKKTRSARKAKQQQVASRDSKRQRPASPASRPPVEDAEVPPAAESAVTTVETPPPASVAPPSPSGLTSLVIEPALAAPPDVRRVPPAHTLRSPLADIPAVTLFMPNATTTAEAPAPVATAPAALPPPAAPPIAAGAPAETEPLPPATSRIHKQPDTIDEATWWRSEGQPAVMDLRDCLAAYAAREAPRQPETSLNALVVEASRTECRASLEEMMTTLTMRYGSERLEPVMGTLITDTFMPAARAAAEEAMRTAQSQAPAP